MPVNLENSAVATGLESSIFIPIPKKNNVKEYSNYHRIEFISHVSKVMLKILQSRLQEYMNQELPDIQLDFEEIEEPEIKVPTFIVSWGKQRNSIKHLLLLH